MVMSLRIIETIYQLLLLLLLMIKGLLAAT